MADFTPPPVIQVDATPVNEQMKVAVRQVFLMLGSGATALGAAGAGHVFTLLSAEAATVVTGISALVTLYVLVLGQVHARKTQQQAKVMAAAAPNDVAVVKSP